MSTVTSDPNNFIVLAQAFAAANNNHISAGEIAFWDEVLFHHSQDFSLAVYLDLPPLYQPLAVPLLTHALSTPDPYTGL